MNSSDKMGALFTEKRTSGLVCFGACPRANNETEQRKRISKQLRMKQK
jgi:hypothetical protein